MIEYCVMETKSLADMVDVMCLTIDANISITLLLIVVSPYVAKTGYHC